MTIRKTQSESNDNRLGRCSGSQPTLKRAREQVERSRGVLWWVITAFAAGLGGSAVGVWGWYLRFPEFQINSLSVLLGIFIAAVLGLAVGLIKWIVTKKKSA